MSDQSVEARRGRAFLLDGRLMYSPNSQRVIQSPPPHRINNVDVNPFQPNVRWEALLHPPRWTRAFGWVSFIPMSRHHFHTTPFHQLSFFQQLKYEDGLFSMHEDTVKSWDELGSNIRTVVLHLQNHFHAPLVPPYVPRGWGYDKRHCSERKARALTHASRDWFLVWMGAISFLIAYSKAPNTSQARSLAVIPFPNGSEPWQEYLHTFQELLRFVQELATSSVVGYTPEAQRVGIVVDFVEKEDPYQPAVDWFFSFGIPVWYPWDASANDFAMKHHLTHLIPPTDMLQQCCPSFLHTPSALPAVSTRQAPSSSDQAPRPSSSDQPPAPGRGSSDAASRAAQIATIIQEFEARVDAEAAANRARKPPEVNAEVYEYTADYETPGKLVCEKIVKSSRRDTLGQYHENQCRYFPELNLWICCADLSPDNSVDDDDDDIYPQPLYVPQNDQNPRDTPLQDPPPHNPPPPQDLPPQNLPPPPPASSTSASSLSLTDLSPAGFADTYADDNGPSNLEQDILLSLSRFLGQARFFKTSIARDMHTFISQCIQAGGPPAARCDLLLDNRMTLSAGTLRDLVVVKAPANTFTKSAKLEAYWYLFDVGVGYNDRKNWKLALTTATDALAMCRLDRQMTYWDVAAYLLKNGIPFRTFRNYEFNGDDYDSYLRLRNHMLKHPRMRAALLRGGIIWRLAVGYLVPEDALYGPSYSSALISIVHPHTSEQLANDSLSEIEVQLLAGAYVCYTGNGKQIAIKSWWPLPEAFEQGEDLGRWTAVNEDWYQNRLAEIKAGTASPLNRKRWRDTLRGLKEQRTLRQQTEKRARRFIQSQVPKAWSHLGVKSLVD
ncbi:hypothetical protein BKA70DRAFT_1448133 [Coprinopsis sp. MPI-PUGE-AT-0042]|nr:hypothetical protein BKA70DRAFT_1448133 [Coprinopsis sp. MPI-PUGE-AT-0042]